MAKGRPDTSPSRVPLVRQQRILFLVERRSGFRKHEGCENTPARPLSRSWIYACAKMERTPGQAPNKTCKRSTHTYTACVLCIWEPDPIPLPPGVTTVASLLLQASSSSLSPNHHPWHGMHSTNAQNGSMAQHQQAAAHETRGALPCSLLPFCSAFW